MKSWRHLHRKSGKRLKRKQLRCFSESYPDLIINHFFYRAPYREVLNKELILMRQNIILQRLTLSNPTKTILLCSYKKN